MVTDLCIAAVLAWALRRKKTGFAATDTVVDRIIRMTVQTGVITAVVNTLDMLSFLFLKARCSAVSGKTINFMWNIPVSKLYSNCMMSTLNARAGFKDTLAAPVVGSLGSLGRTDPKDLDSTDPGGFVAAPRFNSENKDTMVDINNTYQTQDFADDAAYGIRMSRIVERT
ncbi:hypothetical protein B0H16DRAFT_1726920 [Mycena metata]|uniref:DUF6534 domain-containing protein n=1 Tax=Mycena metata TaxID=1033252 RepID=A0AAD7IM55_9AGAR|nr:hypothetical protein B0H16DRAFT_1726920 [Mycena metata]